MKTLSFIIAVGMFCIGSIQGTFASQKLNVEANMRILNDAHLQMSQNRDLYNTVNDSIFMPATRGMWVKRFQRRAECFKNLYQSNSAIYDTYIKICKEMHNHDMAEFNDSLTYTDLASCSQHNAHLSVLNELVKQAYFMQEKNDIPFVTETLARALGPCFEEYMPHSELTLLGYALIVRAEYEISLLGDAQAGKSMVHYAQKMLEFEDRFDSFSDDFVRVTYLSAYQYLLYVGLIRQGAISPMESISYWEHAKNLRLKHPDLFFNPKYKNELTLVNRNISEYDIHYAMSYVMPKGGWTYHEPLGDKMVRSFLDRMEAEQSYRTLDHYCDFASAMCYMGYWSADDMYNNAFQFYSHELQDIKYVTVADIATMAYIVKNLGYMLVLTTYSEDEKRRRITDAYDFVMRHIRVCQDRQYNYELADIVRKMLCDKVASRYIASDLKLKYIKEMLLSTQVQTYAHSTMVAKLSEEILDGIIDYKPELLVGLKDINSVKDIEDKAVNISLYLNNAALLHDVGKLTIIEVVRNDYLPLSEHEYALLKLHPERGKQFLMGDAKLMKYMDPMLGHHKWYDESHGYPEDFDHRKSPYRLLIEIMTIADCLDAATDHLGRNYAHKKTFDDLVNELKEGAGTRYNPDIVDVIVHNKDLNNSLREQLKNGWTYNYFEVYKDYFSM